MKLYSHLSKMRHWRNLLRQIHIRQFSQTAKMSKRIAVCQMTSVSEKLANLEVVSKLIRDAAKENVEMIFFPEACDYIGENKKDIVAMAEPIVGGNIVGKYRELALKYNVWLSMGGVHEMDVSDPSKMYNTHIIINNKGDIVQAYRKLHLFDVEIPEKNIRLKESDFSHAGGHVVTPVETPIGKIGMAICYDMRFPELSTALSIMGAEVLTFPSAFTVATGQAHWHVLLRSQAIENQYDVICTYAHNAKRFSHGHTFCVDPWGRVLADCGDSVGSKVAESRAIENQCYVISAAQTGAHNAKRSSYGHALCVDPWGGVLADCGDSVGFRVAEIDGSRLREVRRNMPVFQHRRREIYSLYTLSLRKNILPIHSTSSDTTGTSKPNSGTESQNSERSRNSGMVCTNPGNTVLDSGSKSPDDKMNVFGHVRVPESCVFYRSKLSYAFVNLRCVIPGHVLVAPTRAAERNSDLTDEEAEDFFKAVRSVQKLMETVHDTNSCTVTIQDGEHAGQTVKHLHCHIMPRKKGDFIENDLIYLELAKHDQFKSGHPAKPPRSLEEMQSEAEMLRKELKRLSETKSN